MELLDRLKSTWSEGWYERHANQSTYSAVSKTEEHAESGIDSQDRPQRWQPWWSSIVWRTVTIVFIVATCAYMWSTTRVLQTWGLPSWMEVYPNYIRNQPNLLVEWNGEDKFSWDTPGSNEAWGELIPTGLGHMRLQDDEIQRYGLGRGKKLNGVGSGFAVSGFHQLHCLAMLREAFYRLLEDPGVAHQMSAHPGALNLTNHLGHCFDYIRQGIMCAADPTIESVHHHSKETSQDNGWGNTHVCRSWDALKDFVETKKANDLTGLSLEHYFENIGVPSSEHVGH